MSRDDIHQASCVLGQLTRVSPSCFHIKLTYQEGASCGDQEANVAYSCISLNVICFEPLTAWLVRTSVVCVCVCVSPGGLGRLLFYTHIHWIKTETWAPVVPGRESPGSLVLGGCHFTVASSAAWGSSPARVQDTATFWEGSGCPCSTHSYSLQSPHYPTLKTELDSRPTSGPFLLPPD